MDDDSIDKAFLGTGWAFPVTPAGPADVALVDHEEDVRQSIRIILSTTPGERVMRPDFGAGLNALVFEPLNAATVSLAKHHVELALLTWEPRIDSISVAVSADRPNGMLTIDVRYRVRATNVFYNLVYPFYLTEGQRP